MCVFGTDPGVRACFELRGAAMVFDLDAGMTKRYGLGFLLESLEVW